MLLKQKTLTFSTLFLLLIATSTTTKLVAQTVPDNNALHQLFDDYYEDRFKLFPLEATYLGDTGYNDRLPNDGSHSFLNEQHAIYTKYLKRYLVAIANKHNGFYLDA